MPGVTSEIWKISGAHLWPPHTWQMIWILSRSGAVPHVSAQMQNYIGDLGESEQNRLGTDAAGGKRLQGGCSRTHRLAILANWTPALALIHPPLQSHKPAWMGQSYDLLNGWHRHWPINLLAMLIGLLIILANCLRNLGGSWLCNGICAKTGNNVAKFGDFCVRMLESEWVFTFNFKDVFSHRTPTTSIYICDWSSASVRFRPGCFTNDDLWVVVGGPDLSSRSKNFRTQIGRWRLFALLPLP